MCNYWNQVSPQKQKKTHDSQACECDKLKLKTVVLYDGNGKEVHMTQLVRFAAEDLGPVV